MMKPIKITIAFADGSAWYTDDATDIRNIGKVLPRDVPWRRSSSVEAARAKYHVLLGEIVKHGETGYDKLGLHDVMKALIMPKLVDFPHYYTTGEPEFSTKHLTQEGWMAVIDHLKVLSNELFGYIFKS